MNKNKPKVTIVTVTYNAVNLLEQTIKSVILQDYINTEYIMIDGASTDGTIDIIKKNESNLNYWISEPDKGIYDAMNKAIDKASGEWIIFMNAGDTFYSNDSIEKFLQDVNPDAELYNGSINFIDNVTGEEKVRFPHGLEKIWITIPCWHQASFIKTSLMKEYKYSLEYKIAGDHDFYLKCFKNNKVFQFTNTIIANMLDGGVHQQQAKLAHIESIYIIAKYSPDINLVYNSNFYKNFYMKNPFLDNFIFSKSFNLFYSQLEEIKQKYQKIALYGYGTVGKTITQILKDKIEVIIDQNKIIDNDLHCPIIHIQELSEFSFDVILISVLGREEEIIETLLKQNILIDSIKTLKISYA